jgi:hypothetical protein
MRSIVIRDTAFAHAEFSTDYQKSLYIKWDRREPRNEDTVFYTDDSLSYAVTDQCKQKIAWLLEPFDLQPHAYSFVFSNQNLFDIVLSHNREFIKSLQNSEWVPFGGCWIKEEDQQVYHKSRLASIIASSKNWMPGHQLRHSVISSAPSYLDVAGRGYREMEYKLEMLKDHCFHVVIENTRIPGYFTEKLIDSFMTGTVPIYWGDPDIEKVFDTRGMIICKNQFEILSALNSISFEKYEEMKQYVYKNFKIANEYKISEDWIFGNVLNMNINKI